MKKLCLLFSLFFLFSHMQGRTYVANSPGAGLLNTVLMNTETSVIISGEINQDDLNYLNSMPNLRYMDLSGANIVASGGFGDDEIGDGVFINKTTLKTVLLPTQTRRIGNGAFAGCTNIYYINFGEAIEGIMDGAFDACTSLRSLIFPRSIRYIGNNAFANLTLNNIYFQDTPTPNLEPNSFENTTISGRVHVTNGIAGFFSGVTALNAYQIEASFDLRICTVTCNPGELEANLNARGFNPAETKFIKVQSGSILDVNDLNYLSNLYEVWGIDLSQSTVVNNEITENCFAKHELLYISLPEGLERIRPNAFMACKFPFIKLPESMLIIEDNAFYDTGIKSIIIPERLVNISQLAFDNSELTEYSVVTSNADYVDNNGILFTTASDAIISFPSKKVLNNYIIPTGVISIKDNAFKNSSLTGTITMPNTLNAIGSGAFSYSTGITNIVYSSNLRTISDEAFRGCRNLVNISVPYGITYIGKSAFTDCTAATSLTIPTSVTTIGDYAYSNTGNIGAVSLPSSITSLGSNVFSGSKLTSYNWMASVNEIPYGTFANCSQLTSTPIPTNITKIGDVAFYNCTANTGTLDLTLNTYLLSIESYAFANNNITTLMLPNNLTKIGMRAFLANPNLSTIVNIPAGLMTLDNEAFANCSALTNPSTINWPTGITYISSAFRGCPGITGVSIPNATIITDNAFAGCTGLNSITIPSGVTYIGSNAFYNTGLTSIVLPNSVATIQSGLFANCSNLNNVTFGSGVTTVNGNALANCTNLQRITVRTNVLPSTDATAFSGLTKGGITVYGPWNTMANYTVAGSPWIGFNYVITEAETPAMESQNLISCAGGIKVKGAVLVYSLQGKLLKSVGVSNDWQTIELPAGAYIVKAAGETRKVMVQ